MNDLEKQKLNEFKLKYMEEYSKNEDIKYLLITAHYIFIKDMLFLEIKNNKKTLNETKEFLEKMNILIMRSIIVTDLNDNINDTK